MVETFTKIKTGKDLLEESLTNLNELDDFEMICNEPQGHKYILIIKNILSSESFTEKNKDCWPLFDRLIFDQVMLACLDHLSNQCDEFNLVKFDENNSTTNKNDIQISNLNNLIQILFLLTELQFQNECLIDFIQKMIDKDLIQILISFFERDKFLSKYTKKFDFQYIIISIMKIFRNISENKQLKQTVLNENLEFLVNFAEYIRMPDLYNRELNQIKHNLKEKSLNYYLEYLNEQIQNNNKDLLNDYKSYESLLCILKQIKMPVFNNYELLSKYKLDNIFNKLLDMIYEVRNEIDFDNLIIQFQHASKIPNKNELVGSIFYYLLSILNELHFRPFQLVSNTSTSSKITEFIKSSKLNQLNQKIIKLYLDFLSDVNFIDNVKKGEYDFIMKMIYFIDGMLKFLNVYKKEWSDLNVTNNLIKFVDVIQNDQNLKNIRILSCWIIAYSQDDENSNLPCIKELLSFIFSSLKTKNEQIYLNKSLRNVLSLLGRLSLIQNYKEIIYKEFDLIEEIIFKCNASEKIYAFKFLIQFCFNKDYFKRILANQKLINYIVKLSARKENDHLKLMSQNVSFLFKNSYMILGNKPNNEAKPIDKNVFLSLNSSSSSILTVCKKIQLNIEQNGYKVINNLNDSFENMDLVLEKQKNLIEQASYFLICVDENYRLNELNQIEAKYASNLNKKMIGLLIQSGVQYENGWIGSILNKNILDFTTHDQANISINKLLQQMKEVTTDQIVVKKVDTLKTRPSFVKKVNRLKPSTSSSIEEWNHANVIDWLEQNQINNSIIQFCMDDKLNGKKLIEWYLFKKSNPEFFYNHMVAQSKNKIGLSDFAHFEKCLNELLANYN